VVCRSDGNYGLHDICHGIVSSAACGKQVNEQAAYSLSTNESLMKTKEIINRARELAKPFRISKGKDFRLKDVDPDDTLEFTKEADKPRAKEALATGVAALAELQEKLYAQDKWALLLIFQAMDAAGKDGAIKHVMSGVNPQGCQVYSFKSPSSEDLDHDYLWRCMKCLPNRGQIGIFNRSYYEEVPSFGCIPNSWQRKSCLQNS
jgi:polyphosphate kinase 2 (PPK2 family)